MYSTGQVPKRRKLHRDKTPCTCREPRLEFLAGYDQHIGVRKLPKVGERALTKKIKGTVPSAYLGQGIDLFPSATEQKCIHEATLRNAASVVENTYPWTEHCSEPI